MDEFEIQCAMGNKNQNNGTLEASQVPQQTGSAVLINIKAGGWVDVVLDEDEEEVTIISYIIRNTNNGQTKTMQPIIQNSFVANSTMRHY